MRSLLKTLLLLFLITPSSRAEQPKPPDIKPFEIPSYTGKAVDWRNPKPAINELPKIDSDAIFKVVNRCYPLKSGFGLDISLKAGATYKDTNNSTQTRKMGRVITKPITKIIILYLF